MRQITIGVYDHGMEQVKLVLRSGVGGNFTTKASQGSIAVIEVGADARTWREVVDSFLHETIELSLLRMNCRFAPNPDYSQDHSAYIFVATHQQFCEAISRASFFVSQALPDLSHAWKKWPKQNKA